MALKDKAKKVLAEINEDTGASRVKDMTGPKRNIGPDLRRVEKSDDSLMDRLNTFERDAIIRGKNREKEAINSRTRSAPDYKKGGKVKKYARGGGCEVRGKTKGRMV